MDGSTSSLTTANANNSGVRVGFGSSGFVYSSSPLRWPIDAYTVLFDPLPFNAHGSGEYAAALENTGHPRRLRRLIPAAPDPAADDVRPALRDDVPHLQHLFIYAFAALGNLGLIYRERVMLLPFLMVPVRHPPDAEGSPADVRVGVPAQGPPEVPGGDDQHDRMVRSMRLALRRPQASAITTAGRCRVDDRSADRSTEGRPSVDALDGGQHPTPPPSSGSP